jgi:hypothetical protein
MPARDVRDGHATGFRNGELVEVKSVEEILSTLDERGRLEALPFMPEMLAYCGKRFRVYKQAIKFCDTKDLTGYHRMHNAIHLENLRCDGSGHGGCQAGCLLYWKQAWLRPIKLDEHMDEPSHPQSGDTSADSRKPIPAPDAVAAGTRVEDPSGDGETVYACQATDLTKAGHERLPWWDARMYVRDVRSGNVGLLPMLHSVLVMLFNKLQAANRRFLPGLLIIQNGKQWPFIMGRLTKTPKETLGLQPGELVEVKSKEEIFRTLDTKNKNRGLMFDVEMLIYCGKQARVMGRVERIINEKTGRMMKLPGDCIILDDVICAGVYHQYCPRGIYPYWREIWLRRVEHPRVGSINSS